MSLEQLFPFLLVSVAFIAMPGPNILVIVSTALVSGKLRGLQTVLGTSLAMIVQLVVAALGTSLLLALLSQGLLWLKWCGVAYLLFLGLNSIHAFYTQRKSFAPSAAESIQRGFWVSLSNPKTILFFSAFLPQFVNANGAYLPQVAVLSASFFVLAVVIDSGYAILSARLRWLLASNDIERLNNGLSGPLYIGAAGLLASSKRA